MARHEVTKIHKVQFAIYLYLENVGFAEVRQISQFLEVDIAVITKHLKYMETNKIVISDNERPKKYTIRY